MGSNDGTGVLSAKEKATKEKRKEYGHTEKILIVSEDSRDWMPPDGDEVICNSVIDDRGMSDEGPTSGTRKLNMVVSKAFAYAPRTDYKRLYFTRKTKDSVFLMSDTDEEARSKYVVHPIFGDAMYLLNDIGLEIGRDGVVYFMPVKEKVKTFLVQKRRRLTVDVMTQTLVNTEGSPLGGTSSKLEMAVDHIHRAFRSDTNIRVMEIESAVQVVDEDGDAEELRETSAFGIRVHDELLDDQKHSIRVVTDYSEEDV
jgi:hypothetical protein